ncbi:MAG TPA: carbohydrate kinase [Desulfobacteraceae bacterium]|nr:carbohydrate kinase [Deltaproteobacteria bacterium]RLB99061.1 MAG: carbohydrate kinase [Deltaproteobacteria bacterium]HDI60224.1 carbohydrate kinase [Desulfobacteraceae bacterium]
MITAIGEALVDEFPDSRRVGGAPLNFAIHVQHLGCPVRFVTRLGDDESGRLVLETMKRHGLDTSGVQIDAQRPTGTVRVKLSENGTPAYDIVADAAYDAIAPPKGIEDSRLVYYGTLAQRTEQGFEGIQQTLRMLPPAVVRFMDINLRPGNYQRRTVEASLSQSELLKLSQEELNTLGAMLFPRTPARDLPQALMAHFDIDEVLLTAGAEGAAWMTRQGDADRVPAAPAPRIVDTVGAGDAFAAVWVVGWLKGVPAKRRLAAAAAFAAHICSLPGALPAEFDCYRSLSQMLGD